MDMMAEIVFLHERQNILLWYIHTKTLNFVYISYLKYISTRGSKYQIFDGTEEGLPPRSPIKNVVLRDEKEFRRGSIAPQYLTDEEGLPRRGGQILWDNTDEEKFWRGDPRGEM